MIDTIFEDIKSHISYKHLHINEDKNEIVFIGYKFDVTSTEYLILHALVKHNKKPLSVEKISDITKHNFTKESLSYHVFNINKKAKAMGGRPLIKNIAKIGYFLNEEM